MQTLFYAIMQLTYHTVSHVVYMVMLEYNEEINIGEGLIIYILRITNFVGSAVLLFLVTYLFIFHCDLVRKNSTTIEELNT